MTPDADLPFTGLQFYLANAHNTVHALLTLKHDISAQEFRQIVATVLEHAPQLAWEEDTRTGAYRACQTAEDILESSKFEAFETIADADHALDDLLSTDLADTGKAAFQAFCQKIKTEDGTIQSRLIFHTTHGIMEGSDVAHILRGRLTVRNARPVDDARLGLLGRCAASALVPLMWVAHLLMARRETRDPATYGHVRFFLDRAAIRAATTKHGVSQRSFLFAIASEAYRRKVRPGKAVNILYSTLPARRSRLIDDEYLNVRTDEVTFHAQPTLEDYVAHTHDRIAARGATPMFMATCQRKLLRIHMAVHRRFPWVYPKAFFGFSPQDLILSMIPPVKTEQFSPKLEGAVVVAGSNTGTATSCIFVPGETQIGLSFWTNVSAKELQSEVDAILTELGVTGALQPHL